MALVAALASQAELLLLDEPTSGLDPLMEAAFTESIREVKAEGRSVLLSSHIFAEVEKLADRVTIIRDGVHRRVRHDRRAAPPDPHPGHGAPDGAPYGLAALPGVHDLRRDRRPRDVRRRRRRAASVLAAVAALIRAPWWRNPPSLEELFLRHYGDELAALDGGAT